MSMAFSIQVRLTRQMYERIKGRSQERGFSSLSSYMRFVALDQDFVLFQKVHEIHAHLLPVQRKETQKRKCVPWPSSGLRVLNEKN